MVLVMQIAAVLFLRPLFVLLFRPQVRGDGLHIKKFDQPILFVVNHVSYADALLLVLLPLKMLRKVLPIYYPTASMYMNKWYIRILIAPMGAYPVYRWSSSLDEYLDKTIMHVASNHTVLLFPEGQRVLDGKHVEGKPGVGRLCDMFDDLTVVPLRIKFMKSKFWPFPKLQLIVGSEIKTKTNGSSVEDYKKYSNQVLQEIYSLK